MIKEAIIKLAKKQDLTYTEAEAVMNEIMSGGATPVQMASYLTALSMKGETIEEITASCGGDACSTACGCCMSMDVLEIVGTGGDGFEFLQYFDHVLPGDLGSRRCAGGKTRQPGSVQPKCGAADVLEALGVKITIASGRRAQKLLEKIGLCFLFAQNYHLSMKYVAPVRKELGIRTIFNILRAADQSGRCKHGADGRLRRRRWWSRWHRYWQTSAWCGAMVVYGQDGLDEICMSAPTTVCESQRTGSSLHRMC